MITLCMDTSHTFLALGLIRDDTVIAKIQKECWKKQSEEIFPELMKMMDEQNMQPEDIDQIVISKGPGSYTGVRIAMTVAKVFCSMSELPLYTLGTMQLYAGLEKCRVLVDARGKRAYTCMFADGEPIEQEHVEACEDIASEINDEKIIGNGALIGKADIWPDIIDNFCALKDHWVKAENVHLVVPDYLKSAESYLPQHH